MARTARHALPGALLAATLLVAGCGSDAASDSSPVGDAPAADSSKTWKPVTVTGVYGDAVVDTEPTDVLALSATDADLLLSVGVQPMAVPAMEQTDAATGGTSIYPWQEAHYEADTPRFEAPVEGLSLEAVAAADPDLIVATAYFGLDERIYRKLSAIAPVVHFDTEANADAWQDATRKVASAVGHDDEAEAAITDAESVLGEVRTTYPELDGKVYNAVISPSADGVWILCSTSDNLARVMEAFGLVLSDYAQSVDCDGGKAQLSWEAVPDLDADVLWAIPDNADQMGALTGKPLWEGLSAVQREAVVTVPKTDGVPFALAFPSPLSLTWAVEQLAPPLADAAAN